MEKYAASGRSEEDMGKPTGFMDYDRKVSRAEERRAGIKHYFNSTSTCPERNSSFRVHAVWNAACPSASPA